MSRQFLLRLATLFLTLAIARQVIGAEIEIKTNFVPEGAREQLPLDLLNLAFSYDAENKYRLTQHHENVNQERLRGMVNDGQISIMWVGTRPDLEEDFIPIRVPLFKGLLGHRIFIIRNGEQAKFSQVNTLQDLLALSAGQGRYWGDTPILENAGIPVVKPVKYPNLFHMLDGERFDYFPRAVHEPWDEVASRPELNLTIESDLMLVYPMPLYFFTSKQNQALADTLERGLLKAIDDGSYDEVFLNNAAIQDAIERTNIQNRRVFRISNPSLSRETPLNNKKLWFDIQDG